MYCEKCGKKLREGARFCNMCGRPVVQQVSNNKQTIAHNTAILQQPQTVKKDPHNREIISNSSIGFLALNEILIDEKVNAFKFANSYKVYDLQANLIGAVEQVNISGGAKAARMLLGGNTKAVQKFQSNILNVSGNRLASIQRDGGAFASIDIKKSDGTILGSLKRGQVFDTNGSLLCRMKSDWKGWNLSVLDSSGNVIGEVHKRWNGIGKEFFTTADKYYVKINESVTGDQRVAIFGSALIYDIILHEFS